ncbi:MAG: alkylphosphonate utilization protein [Candidatus Gracilibacteria bacterium]|nr:alkylphosphonate utilization protein [Candidatus Gracilibacteria bacterium]
MNDISQEATKDSNGNILENGDSVMLIKDLKLKGSNTTLKQGTVYKIRLTDNVEEVECKDLVLKTCFVKKKK